MIPPVRLPTRGDTYGRPGSIPQIHRVSEMPPGGKRSSIGKLKGKGHFVGRFPQVMGRLGVWVASYVDTARVGTGQWKACANVPCVSLEVIPALQQRRTAVAHKGERVPDTVEGSIRASMEA